MVKLASGTVEGVYPSPVVADNWDALVGFVNTELKDHSDKFGLSVSMFLTNKFDDQGNYVPASIKGMNENDFCTTRGALSETTIERGFQMIATERYRNNPLFRFETKTIEEMKTALESKAVSGTIAITFKCYPDGYRCNSATIKQFLIVM